ncbi:tudor domain-containing protein 1 isoform X2 [Sceloporus undulatus]|uniref:tudor domain-containing protein 1 isoform X2 n=1 Tax=Sceloporus undulatus TaxID=8520 RepID=UPI001C4B63F3|nr:tudor domain-containing protein 1 isoform X2 [Sceloporus undulatus]
MENNSPRKEWSPGKSPVSSREVGLEQGLAPGTLANYFQISSKPQNKDENAQGSNKGKDVPMDAHKMAQRFHVKNKDLKIPNESLRCPYTGPNTKGSPLEDKTSALLNNFLICDQTKLFVTNDGGSIESSHDGSRRSNINGEPKANSLVSATYLLPSQSVALKPSNPERDLKMIDNAISLPPSSANEINPVSGSTIPLKQKKLKSCPDNALSRGCDPQFNPLYEPSCHFCGLFGSLRCTQCKQICYCSVDCQKKDWQMHSVVCKPVKLNTDKVEDKPKALDEIKKKENVLSVNTNETEGQDKKTMISDLNMLELKKNMKVEGTVTEFLNPNEFYIQINSPEVRSNISKLIVKLKDQGAVIQDEYNPTKGEVGIAEFSLDQNWYRVLINDVDILKKNAHVLFIDFGNQEVVQLNKIKRLPKDIAHFPPCAIKCCADNALFVKEEWNGICRNAVAPVLIGTYCSLTIINILMDEIPCFVVDVTLPDSGKHLHEIFLEMKGALNLKNGNIKMSESITGSSVEKLTIQEKKIESKAHSGCLTPNIISLSIGDSFLGMVAHIQTPGDFFCQRMENGCKLSELQVSLNEYCARISTSKDFCPAVGDTCCAQFTGDKQWYRASVLSCASEKTVLVGYVDYGNAEVLHLNKLRPIVPELMELSFQAIKCTLAGVKPKSRTWSTEATSVMTKLLQNKVVTIKVIDKKENTFVVEITDELITPIVDVSSYLLKSGYAVEESPSVRMAETRIGSLEEVSDQKVDLVDPSWVTLTVKQVVNVMVCVLYNPSEFYCQLLNSHDLIALEELNLSLAEYCQKTAPNVSKVTKGDLCCAYFSDDGRWYRALVKNAASVEVCQVLFVDYGNCEEVTMDNIRPISATFMKLPFQAVKCGLSGVRPVNDEWTKEATTTLQTFIAGKKLQAKVVSLINNSAEVELIDNTTGSPVMINDILIERHLAFKKEIIPNQKMPSDELVACYFQEMSPTIQWKTAKFAVGETVPVHVLDVVNPGLFYVVPTKPIVDPQDLHKLMTELADYCSFQNDCILEPKVGEPCCARFSGDNKWYRALVLEISISEVKVAYADYGNVEVLPNSKLLPITAPFLKLPFQILKCSLAGITKPDGNWSVQVTEKLKSLLLNECVMITVKGVNATVHEVTVQKNGENCILEIADEQVIENSVKDCSSGNQCAEKSMCCCTELKKQVAKLERIVYLLLKDHFGEDKLLEIIKSSEQ